MWNRIAAVCTVCSARDGANRAARARRLSEASYDKSRDAAENHTDRQIF